jgi:hypothetical protein
MPARRNRSGSSDAQNICKGRGDPEARVPAAEAEGKVGTLKPSARRNPHLEERPLVPAKQKVLEGSPGTVIDPLVLSPRQAYSIQDWRGASDTRQTYVHLLGMNRVACTAGPCQECVTCKAYAGVSLARTYLVEGGELVEHGVLDLAQSVGAQVRWKVLTDTILCTQRQVGSFGGGGGSCRWGGQTTAATDTEKWADGARGARRRPLPSDRPGCRGGGTRAGTRCPRTAAGACR